LGAIVAAVVAGLRRIVGLVWSSTHTEHLQHMPKVDAVVSFLGSIVSWPVLLFANVCMT
jgi:hypothetical protein